MSFMRSWPDSSHLRLTGTFGRNFVAEVLGKITWLCDSDAIFRHGHRGAGRFIPVFSIAGVALSDARKAMSRLDASGSFVPFTKAAANA